jgi:hypothetical protein
MSSNIRSPCLEFWQQIILDGTLREEENITKMLVTRNAFLPKALKSAKYHKFFPTEIMKETR